MITIFHVRASDRVDERTEERIMERLADALEPDLNVLTIGVSYICDAPNCYAEHDHGEVS